MTLVKWLVDITLYGTDALYSFRSVCAGKCIQVDQASYHFPIGLLHLKHNVNSGGISEVP